MTNKEGKSPGKLSEAGTRSLQPLSDAPESALSSVSPDQLRLALNDHSEL